MLSGFFAGNGNAVMLVAGATATEVEEDDPVTSGLEGVETGPETGPDTGTEPHPASTTNKAPIAQLAQLANAKRSHMGLISGGFFWLGFAFFFGQWLNVQKHLGFGGVSIV